MKTLFKSKIIFVFTFVVSGLLFSCKNSEQDGYSDKIETLQAGDTAKNSSDTTEVSGLSTTNKSTKGSSGTDKGGTGTGTGPGESPKDGATDSGPSEKPIK